MKFINLVYAGFAKSDGLVDFTKTTGSVSIVSGIDATILKRALFVVLYGAGEDYSFIEYPSSLKLTFEYSNTTYVLERAFTNVDGIKTEKAIICDENGVIITENVESFVASAVCVAKEGFADIVVLDKDAIYEAFSSDVQARESFVDSAIFRLSGPSDSGSRLDKLHEQEKKLVEEIEAIPPTTQEEIDEVANNVVVLSERIERLRISVEEIAKDVSIDATDVNTKAYADAVQESDALKSEKAALTEEGKKVQSYIETKKLAEEYLALKDQEKAVSDKKDEITAIKAKKDEYLAEIAQLKTQVGDKESSLASYEAFIKETGSRLQSTLKLYTEKPVSFDIGRIASYYSEADAQKNVIIAEKLSVDNAYKVISTEIAGLRARKNDIKLSAEYRKSIYEAAVLENAINKLSDEIAQSEARISEYEKEKASLVTDKNSNTQTIERLKAEQKNALGKAENYSALREAVNAEYKAKETLLASYYTATVYDEDYNSLTNKIEKSKETIDSCKEKLDKAIADKAQLLKNSEKMVARLKLLQAKRSDYEGFNKMRTISDELLYGSHCPVCDNILTYKKTLPQKDTKALDVQIDAVKIEVTKYETAITECITIIGQREATLYVSEQYLESLIAMKAQLDQKIKALFASQDFTATNLEELHLLLQKANENSDANLQLVEKYETNEIELQKATASNKYISDRLIVLNGNILPQEKEKQSALLKIYSEKCARFDVIKPLLKGESAEELLRKIQIAERENETIDGDIETKIVKYFELAEKRSDLSELLSTLDSRYYQVSIGNTKLTYGQVIVKALSEDLLRISKEEKDNPYDSSSIKDEINALLTKISSIQARIAELEADISSKETELKVKTDDLQKELNKNAELFTRHAITSIESASSIVSNVSVIDDYNARLKKYEETYAELEEKISKALDDMKVDERVRELNADILELQNAHDAELKELQTRKSNLVKIQGIASHLLTLSDKIKNIENITGVMTENEVSKTEFTLKIIEKASTYVYEWSNNRYLLKADELDGVSLLNIGKDELVNDLKQTSEEKMLVKVGIALAYSDNILTLLGGNLQRLLAVSSDEIETTSVKVILEAIKTSNIIVLTENEDRFNEILSKI
ncbi:MAG: hypothetical protein LBU04_06025 [Christensenellaceae bacterium]|jgi:DNA repair exonuclease SbcCD ATPase subunit|nr:hypothetical protein [Christensenellaceae bacterium]